MWSTNKSKLQADFREPIMGLHTGLHHNRSSRINQRFCFRRKALFCGFSDFSRGTNDMALRNCGISANLHAACWISLS